MFLSLGCTLESYENPDAQAPSGFPDGSAVKNLPAMQETRVRSLGSEDPLEKEMATHFSILAWEIPWTEEPDEFGPHSPWGSQKSWTQLRG